MSGLVCVFARDRAPVDPADVEAVLERQSHRGSDGLRVWYDGTVGLGHAALDPTGKGTMAEPLVEDGGRLAVVGDLRIDNHRELTRLLEMSSEQASDAGIVLAAYRRWGIDAPCHLEGPFAFVIWDARQQRIFCARDHLGVKPLTYHFSEKLLVCASEAEAIPCHSAIPRRINEARIADFLVSELEGVNHTSTFFEGVVRLPPAHYLVVEPGRHRLQRYWEPDVETELRLGSDEDYAEVFAEMFEKAVESCLAGVGNPALLLSGGLDSSAIAGFAQSLSDDGVVDTLTAFSVIDVDNDPSPETTNILTTIDHLGIDARTLPVAMAAELPRSERRSLLDCGEPFDAMMAVDRLLLSMAASADCRVVLDGVDGDIVASSAVPTIQLLRHGRVLRAWREATAHRNLFFEGSHPIRMLTGAAFRAWAPSRVNGIVSRLHNRKNRIEAAVDESLIDRDFAREIGVPGRLEQLWSHGRDDPRDDGRARHARTVSHPYVAVALERYDRVAACSGVEVRHPFFDLRLVRLCLSLPWDLKVRDGWTKFLLRLATEGKVMDDIRWRHDYGDVVWRPISRVIEEERAYLGSVLRNSVGSLRPYIDAAKLDQVRRNLDGNPDPLEEVGIWEASTLARWLARIRQ